MDKKWSQGGFERKWLRSAGVFRGSKALGSRRGKLGSKEPLRSSRIAFGRQQEIDGLPGKLRATPPLWRSL